MINPPSEVTEAFHQVVQKGTYLILYKYKNLLMYIYGSYFGYQRIGDAIGFPEDSKKRRKSYYEGQTIFFNWGKS